MGSVIRRGTLWGGGGCVCWMGGGVDGGGWMGGVDGGSPCCMTIIRNGNVTLSILRKGHIALLHVVKD